MKKRSQKIHCILALLSLFTAACASKDIELAHADSQAVETADESPQVESENHAVKLAKRHLALKNRDWGEIAGVQEDENYYRVAFKTPTQELRLIGQRMLLVKKETGLVSVVQRR